MMLSCAMCGKPMRDATARAGAAWGMPMRSPWIRTGEDVWRWWIYEATPFDTRSQQKRLFSGEQWAWQK